MPEFVFWSSIAWLAYVYAGYPLALALLARIRPRDVCRSSVLPTVTIITAAYNEVRCIRQSLENKLGLDYPRDRLQIIVVSDESTDGTDRVVAELAGQGVRLLRQSPRQGKTAALNLAVPEAQGEIVAFADANSIWDPTALRALVRSFADPDVGYVTGKMVYVDETGSLVGDGCDAYMRYENRLRELESRCGSVVGVDGGIDAVRRSLYRPMRSDQLPDFVLPLSVVRLGYRVVYEPEAVLKEHSLSDTTSEYRMRVRVSLRALRALSDQRSLLNPLLYGAFALQLWSHKLLRYLAIVPMVGAFLASAALAPTSASFALLLLGQTAFYAAAALGLLSPRVLGRSRLFAWPAYLVIVNLAAGHAALRWLKGDRVVLWQPRTG